MQFTESTAEGISAAEQPALRPALQALATEALLSDTELAALLGVKTQWVRSHSDEIPGFRPLGSYYRFHRQPVEQWLGGSDRLLQPEEVARLLKVPKSWIYANADEIPGVLRLGRYVRFRPSVIRQFLGGSELAQ